MPPARADAIANRERILIAAREMFAEAGIDAEIKDIAERAGIGVGTIYRNFPTKNDLLAELVRAMLGEIAAGVSTAEDLANPLEGIRLALRSIYESAYRCGWLMEARMTGRLPQSVQDEFPSHDWDSRLQAFVRLIRRCQQSGIIKPDADPRFIVSILTGSIMSFKRGFIGQGQDPAYVADTVLIHILNGVGTTPVPWSEHDKTPDPVSRTGGLFLAEKAS